MTVGDIMEKSVRVTGFAVIDGVLHVYEDPEDLRDVIVSRGFEKAEWLDEMIIHTRNEHEKEQSKPK